MYYSIRRSHETHELTWTNDDIRDLIREDAIKALRDRGIDPDEAKLTISMTHNNAANRVEAHGFVILDD